MTNSLALSRHKLGLTATEVTTLGFGAGALGNLYRAISDEVAAQTLAAALDAGIGYVDTAPHYGQGLSERRVGQYRAKSTKTFTLSSKIGRILAPIPAPPHGTERQGFIDGDPFQSHFDYSYDGVMRSFSDSQKRLQTERIDIVLAHDLGQATHADQHQRHMKDFLDGGYKALRALKDQGLIGAIGLGVNEWQVCAEVMQHVDIDVFLLAGRYTLLEQTALDAFLPQCQKKNISIILGGPFNSGILIEGIKDGVIPHYNYEPASAEIINRVKALQAICAAHHVPLAAAALQFPLAHPSVACIIPGMASPAQVAANLELLDAPIPQGLWDDLKTTGLLHPAAPVAEPVS